MGNRLDLTVHRYGRRHRLRCRVAVWLAALAAAGLTAAVVWRFGPTAIAWLTALPARVETAVGNWVLPYYENQLAELDAENARLREQLAAGAGLRQENQALRGLLGSPAAEAARGAQPMPVVQRVGARFSLAGSAPAGAAVLDAGGRFAGRTAPDPGAEAGVLPVASPAGTSCLAGGQYGVLAVEGDRWFLEELPRHSGLTAGCTVTTADGWWVGVLASAPVEDETGLCARAPLEDTADTGASVYFVVT